MAATRDIRVAGELTAHDLGKTVKFKLQNEAKTRVAGHLLDVRHRIVDGQNQTFLEFGPINLGPNPTGSYWLPSDTFKVEVKAS